MKGHSFDFGQETLHCQNISSSLFFFFASSKLSKRGTKGLLPVLLFQLPSNERAAPPSKVSFYKKDNIQCQKDLTQRPRLMTT